jgi:acetyltransferase
MQTSEPPRAEAARHQQPSDPSADVIGSGSASLKAMFSPRTVAVIGASEREGTVGRTILWNLITSPFGGTVYPVNPKRPNVLGIRSYPSITHIPEQVDLAIIVTPAVAVPDIIRECVDTGVRAAIIISAGFREIGPEGVALEDAVMREARRGQMRIIGPNCLGIMRPYSGLNATFAGRIARPGNVGFISQSGALLTAILDWSIQENVGFSSFISVGSMMDVSWGDLIYYLGNDPKTQSIVIYMESIGDARSFLSAAREVALHKPIIVIKAGRTEQAAKAAASHTGTLAGSDEVLTAAFRRSGVLRVDSIADLFYMAEVLAKQPRPKGPRLTILTNAGGPGVLATDALITGGGKLSQLTDESIGRFNEFLPSAWSHANPIDMIGDADATRYAKSLEVAADDENSDGLLVVMTPQAMTDPTGIADKLKPYARLGDKPVLASWMGGVEAAAGRAILNNAGIPTFPYPDTAARVFNYMWRYTYNLRGLYETPTLPEDRPGLPDRERASEIIANARSEQRALLSELESKALMQAYGIPTTVMRFAADADEAVEKALELGFPVVVKLHSHTITHKVDVGGVKLNLQSEEDVRQAFETMKSGLREAGKGDDFLGVTVQPMEKLDGYEIIVGSSLDPQFGPVLLFGSGGSLVEVYRDRALGLPPLNTTLARRMMEQTKIYEALKGVRGRGSVDMDALERLMVRFSQLVVEQRWIKEIDINPLLVSEDRIIALDARVVLHPHDTEESDLPESAIRPYPVQYVGEGTLRDGRTVTIRPIRPEDEPLMVRFHGTLSEESVYFRYASVLKMSQRVAHERLSRICFIDYDREMALVAEMETDAGREIIAVGRLTRLFGSRDGEFAMLVADQHQGQGLGTEMLSRLIDLARNEGLERIVADVLGQNTPMQHICRKLGFSLIRSEDVSEPMVRAVKGL